MLHLRHDDGEFVAAHAGDDVEFARAAAQALADELEQLVADVMAERVVDALELIEVETEHGQAFAALDALDLVIELLEQQHAIGQIGQCVVARHVRDAVFRALPFGDVFVGGEPAAVRDRLVDDGKGASVRKVHDVVEGLSFRDAVAKPRGVFVGVAGETAELDAVLKQVTQAAARLNDVGRKSVQFEITLIAEC